MPNDVDAGVHLLLQLLAFVPLNQRNDALAWGQPLFTTTGDPEPGAQLSAVLAIRFGHSRLLLTGDLPSEWEIVASAYDLTHDALKGPHHGSREALHPALITSANRSRSWAVTPKNRSGLPKFWDPANGIDALLAKEPSILVTSTPTSWQVPNPLPSDGVVQRDRVSCERGAAALQVVRSPKY